jgi:transposase
MATTIQEERWRWLKPIINKEMSLVDVVKVCPHSESSLKRWKRAYKKHGMAGLIPKSTEPKTSPKETPIRIKERVIEKRHETKLCAKKIHWRLAKKRKGSGAFKKERGQEKKKGVKSIYDITYVYQEPKELISPIIITK